MNRLSFKASCAYAVGYRDYYDPEYNPTNVNTKSELFPFWLLGWSDAVFENSKPMHDKSDVYDNRRPKCLK